MQDSESASVPQEKERGQEQEAASKPEEALANLAERSQAGLLTEAQESMWKKICRAIANAIGRIVEKITGRKTSIGMEQVNNLLTALGQYVINGEQGRAALQADGAMASAQDKSGETNSYGVPMERVTEIKGELTFKALKEALEELAGVDLPNVIEGLVAQVNRNQREKMASRRASEKSHANGYSYGEHSAAAAKIANIWKWAAQVSRETDTKNNKPDLAIRRFASPVKVNGRDGFAWLTVKETEDGLRIYSMELLNKEKLWDYMGNEANSLTASPPAQSSAEKQLRVKLSSEFEKTPYSHRSYEEIIETLPGPVKSASGETSLASLDFRKLWPFGAKQAAQIANAPEIHHYFMEKDLGLLQRIVNLPHWIAKKYEGFAKIYDRQLRRVDERQGALMKSLGEVPSLFGKSRLDKKDMASLTQLVWEIEGKPLPFEQAGKVKRFLPDGQLPNGREKIAPNPKFYTEYEQALAALPYSQKVREAMLEIRKSLDSDLAIAYDRMAAMSEASDDTITKLRDTIGRIYNHFPHTGMGDSMRRRWIKTARWFTASTLMP